MCGRYTLTTSFGDLWHRFCMQREELPYIPRYNIAPSQDVLVVLNDGDIHSAFLRWGLIPAWTKNVVDTYQMINARMETIAMSPVFAGLLRRQRCLVLADGFYEWKKGAKAKVPMRIVLKSGEPFAFAGLWDEWKSLTGEVIRSCTIITTKPNDLVAPIHNRMPAILAPETERVWLESSIRDPQILRECLGPYPSDKMIAYPVSTVVNSPSNDCAACINQAPYGPLNHQAVETFWAI